MDQRTPLALTCQGVCRHFGSTTALADFDLEVARADLVALLGPSGCGKTTALRLIAGLDRPDAGTIRIDGREVAGPRTFVAPERRGVALVFQDYALFPHLDVKANVGYGVRGVDRGEHRKRVHEALELVGMTAEADRLPARLSGGQQQRVALARALAPRPDLVLLDEPFSNLDAALRETVREDVRRILRDAGATAVFVTHDQEEALSIADVVAVMQDGRVHQVADPHTLYTRPTTRFVAEFVGHADLVPARRVGTYLVDTPLGRLPTADPVADGAGAAVLRPEALVLRTSPDGNATVVGVSYFGHDQLVTVALDDGTEVRSRRGPGVAMHRGDRVRVEVDGRVTVFAD